MKCLNDEKIIEYIDNELNSVESAQIRDHLILCDKCKSKYDFYTDMNIALSEPEMIYPPAEIKRNVMKNITRKYSYVSSLFSLIFFSSLMLIAGIYLYFDFANDSLIKALKATSKNTSTLITSFVKFVESVFQGMKIVFIALNGLLEAALNINVGVEIVGMIFSAILIMSLFILFRKIQNLVKTDK